MTLTQGFQLGQLAKAKGMALHTESGHVQLVTVSYNGKGKSTVMTYEEALNTLQ